MDLIKWKKKTNHLPLLLLGARQVGKTYLLKEFAQIHYKDYVYINFENIQSYHSLFDADLNPKRIISDLELYFNKKINAKDTLIIFDEIQYEKKAITALKYFAEEMPDYDIVCAGSLLGVSLQRESFSFPVGKVSFMYLYPFTFDEFIRAIGQEVLLEKIEICYKNDAVMPDLIHKMLLSLYRKYLCIGGMPSAIKEFVRNNYDLVDFDRNVHNNIINSYLADMSKYTTSSEVVKIQAIYKSLPEQLAGDNKKFKYSIVEKGGKASQFGSSIEWLLMSLINIECSLLKLPEFPLSAYKEKGYFKIYMNDVGMLMSLAQIPFKIVVLEGEHNLFKGAITENYVAQHLKINNEELYYWKNNAYEVDFIKVIDDEIIPIEVKSGNNKRSRSLNEYIRLHCPKYAIRLSTNNFGKTNLIKSIPLYAAYLIGGNTIK